MGVLGDVHEIAVAKGKQRLFADRGYTSWLQVQKVRNETQGHVMLLHEKCRYFSIPTLSGAVLRSWTRKHRFFLDLSTWHIVKSQTQHIVTELLRDMKVGPLTRHVAIKRSDPGAL